MPFAGSRTCCAPADDKRGAIFEYSRLYNYSCNHALNMMDLSIKMYTAALLEIDCQSVSYNLLSLNFEVIRSCICNLIIL